MDSHTLGRCGIRISLSNRDIIECNSTNAVLEIPTLEIQHLSREGPRSLTVVENAPTLRAEIDPGSLRFPQPPVDSSFSQEKEKPNNKKTSLSKKIRVVKF